MSKSSDFEESSADIRRKRLQEKIEVEELQLLNEKLQKRCKLIQEESLREKEKASQLMRFLEKENEELRKSNTDILETYYAEKTVLRKRLLHLENEVEDIRGKSELKTGLSLDFFVL